MAERRKNIIENLEFVIVVLRTVVEILKRKQASEDKLLEKGGTVYA